MRRWIALGVTVVGVAWGPYLYTELAPRAAGATRADDPNESQLMAATDVPVSAPEPPSVAEPTPTPIAAPEAPATAPSAPTVEPPASAPAAPEAPAAPAQPNPPAAPPSAPAAPPSAPEPAPEPAKAPEPVRPEMEPPRSADERTRAFHAAFEAETRDAPWADEQEPGIRQLTAAAGIAAEDLVDVACRRSVCKLTFKAPQLPENLEAALQARIKAEYGDSLLETHDPQGDQPARLYVLRSGQPLEAPRPD